MWNTIGENDLLFLSSHSQWVRSLHAQRKGCHCYRIFFKANWYHVSQMEVYCQCILRSTFKPIVSLLDILGKSKGINKHFRKAIIHLQSLIHLWVQLLNVWRYHVYLYKRVKMIRLCSCHSTQEAGTYCLHDMNGLLYEKGKSILEEKEKNLWRCC